MTNHERAGCCRFGPGARGWWESRGTEIRSSTPGRLRSLAPTRAHPPHWGHKCGGPHSPHHCARPEIQMPVPLLDRALIRSSAHRPQAVTFPARMSTDGWHGNCAPLAHRLQGEPDPYDGGYNGSTVSQFPDPGSFEGIGRMGPMRDERIPPDHGRPHLGGSVHCLVAAPRTWDAIRFPDRSSIRTSRVVCQSRAGPLGRS